MPAPNLSFASEANDDDDDGHDDDDNGHGDNNAFGLVNLFADDGASLADLDDSATANNNTEFVSLSPQNASLDVLNESEPMANDESDRKDPLGDVEIDSTQRAALRNIFSGSNQIDIGATDEAAEDNPSGTNDNGGDDQNIDTVSINESENNEVAVENASDTNVEAHQVDDQIVEMNRIGIKKINTKNIMQQIIYCFFYR